MNTINVLRSTTVCLVILVLFFIGALQGADKERNQAPLAKGTAIADDPIVPIDWKFHEIGTLWSRVTNFGKTGDDAYEDRTPSCDWPGGSGNSYLYRGSLWLAGKIDGEVHVTMPEDSEYAPLDSVHQIFNGDRGESETYTRYYDVKAPLAAGHVPLGVEITERTYAWSESYRDDFIIYEFTIKNVGVDTDDDGIPDQPRDIEEFYFTYRLDGDVSKLADWPTEGPYVNQDDLTGVNSSWELLDYFPEWKAVVEDNIEASLGRPDSTLMYMWDGDNPSADAENGQPDDAFNPGEDDTYQSPGFLGFKILKTEPASFKPTSFHVNHIYNDPNTDEDAYKRMMAPQTFEEDGPSGMITQGGAPFPHDYRAILTLGPMDTFAAGDSIVVTAALGMGVDTDSAHVYSLIELHKNMDIAQYIVDIDYDPSNIDLAPRPEFLIEEQYNDEGISEGVKVSWSNAPESHPDFYGYTIEKSSGKSPVTGSEVWEPLGEGTYIDTTNSDSWPPPVDPANSDRYTIVDTDVKNGFDYKYRVKALSNNLIVGIADTGYELAAITPANKPATTLDKVKVVPNPYVGSTSWNNPQPGSTSPWKHRLQFINLPADAKIKIYTLDLDFVVEISAGETAKKELGGTQVSGPASVAEWDLLTRNEQEAAPGVYIYVVDSPSAGQKTGKFVIVR